MASSSSSVQTVVLGRSTKSYFSTHFSDASNTQERAVFFRIFIGGSVTVILALLSIFSIYWGALWKIPAHQLDGWVVNFDGSGEIGTAFTQGLLSSSSGPLKWELRDDLPGLANVGDMIREEKAWFAVVIAANASQNLANAGADYDPTSAVTFYAVEARSENAFRTIIRPAVESALLRISDSFAMQNLARMDVNTLTSVASSSPQAIVKPVSHTFVNLVPFNIPVASAITFVGLIYLTILSYLITIIGLTAREVSGLEKRLTIASLIRLRLTSVAVVYFFISLFYSLVSLAFQVDFSRKFGHSGFLIFWMVNFVGMLSVGLALEAMVTLMTTRFIPFFLIFWIISNVSVAFMPIQVLPHIYRYGYAMPFYNISGAVRTILFGTRNQLPLHFGILISWAALSAINIPLFQWYRRRILHKANED